MVSFIFSIMALGLTALSSAMPTDRRALNSSEFTLALRAQGYPTLSLNTVPHPEDSQTSLYLVFERLAAYPGTPTYLNSTYLNFDVGASKPFSMYSPEVGDDYGIAVPVLAKYGQENGSGGYGIYDGTLSGTLHSAEEAFFACNQTINGEENLVLNWGVFNSNGSAPYECVPAQLIVNHNLGE